MWSKISQHHQLRPSRIADMAGVSRTYLLLVVHRKRTDFPVLWRLPEALTPSRDKGWCLGWLSPCVDHRSCSPQMWAEHSSKQFRAHLQCDDRFIILSDRARLEEFGYTTQESTISGIRKRHRSKPSNTKWWSEFGVVPGRLQDREKWKMKVFFTLSPHAQHGFSQESLL